MSIALRQNWRTAPSRPALRQLLRVDRLEQPSGSLPASPKFTCSDCPFGATALGGQQPVISVDTKKKELVGDFKNGGRE
jgi:hypothetical protein